MKPPHDWFYFVWTRRTPHSHMLDRHTLLFSTETTVPYQGTYYSTSNWVNEEECFKFLNGDGAYVI